MHPSIDFQMVCAYCGSLGIKIENPENAPREAIVYCGDCGTSRGTVGALRDLAARCTSAAHDTTPAKANAELIARRKRLRMIGRDWRLPCSGRRMSPSNPMIVDHAVVNTGFDLRRKVMKPRPANPKIIMAHVEGSGTAAVATNPRCNPVVGSM